MWHIDLDVFDSVLWTVSFANTGDVILKSHNKQCTLIHYIYVHVVSDIYCYQFCYN